MPRLVDSQGDFARALADPSKSAPEDIRRAGRAAQSKRFDIYRNNVVVTAIDALASSFPAVRTLVGDEFFRAVARAYFDHSPLTSPLLFRYGETFGEFLGAFPPAANRVPYLADVARLEFARLQAYHAADAAPLTIAALGAIAPDDLVTVALEAHPSVSLIRSRYPVVSLWAASTGILSSQEVDMTRAEDALTVRPAFDVDTRILTPAGAFFLDALLNGKRLGDAAEAAAEAVSGFDLSEHLGGLFETGVFVQATVAQSCRDGH